MTDEQLLIDQARQGDREAFRALVERSKVATYRLAYDLTGNRHDAEDLSQEAYIRAFRGLRTFRGEAKWSSWLYRITMNTFYDHWRARKKNRVHYEEDPETPMRVEQQLQPCPAPGPEQSAESGVMQQHIERALASLSPQERAVFVLRHYHDLRLKEIAGILEIAEGTVKAYLFRAVKRLQKELSFYRPELGLEER